MRLLSASYSMKTNITGFKCFSKIFASLCIRRKYKPQHWKGLTSRDQAASPLGKGQEDCKEIEALWDILIVARKYRSKFSNKLCLKKGLAHFIEMTSAIKTYFPDCHAFDDQSMQKEQNKIKHINRA